jgi:hypothetical protein
MAEPIRIDGLAQFSRNLRKLDAELPKGLRVALNEAADVVIGYAKPRIPRRTGKAQASLKARSTRTAVRVQGGGPRVPYYPWLDFGGRVGRSRSIRRPFLKDGRYLYAAYFQNRSQFEDVLTRALINVAKSAGVEVD